MDVAQADHLVADDEDPEVIPILKALETLRGISRRIEVMEFELALTPSLSQTGEGDSAANAA